MYSLRPLPFPEVRARWPWLRAGLEQCIERTDERWLAEDIFAHLKDGSCACYVGSTGNHDLGFLIAQRHFDADGPVLFVWAIWGEAGSLFRDRKAIFDELLQLAAQIGAKRIRMESPRKGWQWVDFFVPIRTIYEHEIDYAVPRRVVTMS